MSPSTVQNSTRTAPLNIILERVTSPADIPTLADINHDAIGDDQFRKWMALFTEHTERDGALKALAESLSDPDYTVMKAVLVPPTTNAAESHSPPSMSSSSPPVAAAADERKIIGFIHYFNGYIKLDKIDPFAAPFQRRRSSVVKDVKDVSGGISEEFAEKIESLERVASGQHATDTDADASVKTDTDTADNAAERAARLKCGEKIYTETRNHYIGAIRGKKHMWIRRLMVLPEWQGCGVGRRLMDVVTREADQEKIVCWLFARPAGERLYVKCGFKSVAVTVMDVPEFGFECPETKAMMRLPRPVERG